MAWPRSRSSHSWAHHHHAAPVAFPLAVSLLRAGVSLPALAAFITTLTMVGTVTAPLEIEYFGRRFTLERQGLSFALAVLVGALMGVLLEGSYLAVKRCSDS